MAHPQRVSAPSSAEYVASRRAKEGFAGVPHDVTADPQLSDEGFRLLAALESWAWNKPECRPSNRDIAIRAGWFTKAGEPSVSKVKRVLVELEGGPGRRAYIRRVLVSNDGMNDRSKIELLRPFGVACLAKPSETPGPKIDGGGLKMDRGSPNIDHKEETPEKTQGEEDQCLYPETFMSNSPPSSANVNDGIDDDVTHELRIREAVQVAATLFEMPLGKAGKDNRLGIPPANRFAEILLYLLMEDEGNLGYFREIAWWAHRKEITSLDVDIELRATIEANERGGVLNAGALFRSKMRNRRRITGEVGVRPNYDLEAGSN